MYQRRNPRHRRTPSVVSLLSDTCSTSSSRACVDSARSTSASSDRVHHRGCFDLTSNDFDVNKIQPPSPPPSPPVIHVDTSGADPPQLSIRPSISTSPLPSSSTVTTDIEVIRTATVSSHITQYLIRESSTITLTLTYTDTHVHSLRLKK